MEVRLSGFLKVSGYASDFIMGGKMVAQPPVALWSFLKSCTPIGVPSSHIILFCQSLPFSRLSVANLA